MLPGGIILIVLALFAVYLARNQAAKANAAKGTETLSCADINTLSRGVSAEVGGGDFRQRCEVVGQAAPGEGGAIKAPHSGADCVWHHSIVRHRYWEMQEETVNGQRQRNRVERTEVVSNITSAQPFMVDDGTGSVAVSPDGADVDQPERVLDRFEPAVAERADGPRRLRAAVGRLQRDARLRVRGVGDPSGRAAVRARRGVGLERAGGVREREGSLHHLDAVRGADRRAC